MAAVDRRHHRRRRSPPRARGRARAARSSARRCLRRVVRWRTSIERVRRRCAVDDPVAETDDREGESTEAERAVGHRRPQAPTIPTTIAAEPSASVRRAASDRISEPRQRAARARTAWRTRGRGARLRARSTPRTNSSAVGTSTITTPEPQFESVAVAVPSRNGGEVGRPRRAIERSRGRATRSATTSRNAAPRTIDADGARVEPACRRRVLDRRRSRTPMPNISRTSVTTGTERVRIGPAGAAPATRAARTEREQHHVHAEERRATTTHRRGRLATSGPHAPPMPPSAPQMPIASGCSRRPRTWRRSRPATW